MLVAGLLLTIGVMALFQVWAFSYHVSANTYKDAIAYNMGRLAVEQVKSQGFPNAPEGTVDVYFDAAENVVPSTSAKAMYHVTTSIVSDKVTGGTPGQAGAVPDNAANRSVDVTVRDTATGSTLYSTHTRLVRGGI